MQSFILPPEHQDRWESECLGSKASSAIVTNEGNEAAEVKGVLEDAQRAATQISKETISDSRLWDLHNLFQYKNNLIVIHQDAGETPNACHLEEEEGGESNLRKDHN